MGTATGARGARELRPYSQHPVPLVGVLLTIVLIAYFQGFPCILLGNDSALCSHRSFIRTTGEWQFNSDMLDVVLKTGLCEGTADEDLGNEGLVRDLDTAAAALNGDVDALARGDGDALAQAQAALDATVSAR